MITFFVAGVLAVIFAVIGGLVAIFRKGRRAATFKTAGIVYLAALAIVFFIVGPYLMAKFLAGAGTRPMDQNLTATPADWKLPFEEVEFAATDGVRLNGWFLPPAGKDVILTFSHGLFRNRQEILERAAKLRQLGYGGLLYDSRNHGKSGKAVVSMGYFERQDVLGAIRYLRSRPDAAHAKLVLMGVSMGAAAVLMAAAETQDYDGIIADSPFVTFQQTVDHHAWLFLKMPKYPFVPIFRSFYGRLARFEWADFDVKKAASTIKDCPVLMIYGGGDERIPPEDGRLIFDELRSRQKEFHVVDKATHGAAYRFAPEEYMSYLGAFLEKLDQPPSH